MFLVFIVKLPLFGFHLWLPKAHVEAPLIGSMLLAGVLLKLGGYGIFRFFRYLHVFSFSCVYFLSYVAFLSLVGAFYVSFLCSRQMDLKMVIAYSSVVHISVMVLGLFSFSWLGVQCSFLMMVSHGLISPLLFFLIAYLYEFKHSRRIMILKGLLLVNPLFCLF